MSKKRGSIGEIICLILYVVTAVIGIFKKKWIPLLSIVVMHVIEFFTIGRKTGKENSRCK